MGQEKMQDLGILNRFSLKDRVAVVTGSGSGLGRAIAVGFAQAGADLVVVEVKADAGMATVEEIRALGRKALPLAVDVLDSQQVDAFVAKTLAEFGKIDILVNNVGGSRQTRRVPITELTEEVWDMIIALNLKSNFLCTKAVAKVMIEQKRGSMINVASVSGMRPYPSHPPYGASKAAVINFTQSMAVQLAPYNIRVNAIAPGTIATPTAAYLGDRDERARKRGTLMKRAGRIEDTLPAAIYLASDASGYVTGVTIEVQGGPPFAAFLLEEAEADWRLAMQSGRG